MLVHLDRGSQVPLYLQIRDQIYELILKGDLPEGARLPPERKLAADLGVNRSTVVNAYHELAADGLVEAHVGRGTMVCGVDRGMLQEEGIGPLTWSDYFAVRTQWAEDPLMRQIMDLSARGEIISLTAGTPAPDLYPLEDFRRIVDEVLRKSGRILLQYGATEGHYPLRELIAQRMAARGASVSAENIMILSGSQQGLYLIARAMIEPGDSVVVEMPSYLGALQRQPFSAAGARLLGVPIDEKGMRVDILENILVRHRPKFIYTLPTFQNPTGVTLTLERRRRLLTLARRYRVPILEDDPYSELRYEGEPLPSLKTLDRYGYVKYLSTFSKILFPGLRLGWIAAPRPVIERLVLIKQSADLHTNTLGQWAVYEFCRRGLLDKHIGLLRREYPRRRDAMIEALEEYCSFGMTWNRPKGGCYLWCHLSDGLKARDLLVEAEQHKVAFVAGTVFYADGQGQDALRLNFTYPTEDVIEEGIKRLGDALAELMKRQPAEKVMERELVARPIV